MTAPPDGLRRSEAAPRRAIFRQLWGKEPGPKVVLQPGDVVRVGRAEDCDLSIAGDREMARVHFDIDWDGERSQVRDRDALPVLGGKPVHKAYVPSGSFIQAGSSTFTMHFERHTPPASPPPSLEGARRAIYDALAAEPDLWAVLDAARDPRIVQVLDECVDDARSLYEGPQNAALADVAPYLVRLRADSHLLRLLVEEGWGAAWGIFIAWSASEKEVRRHLRRFLMVESEESREKMYFRFYDPRVLRTFIPTCSVRQLTELFGDVGAFLCEGAEGELLRFDPSRIDELATDDV